MYAVDVFLKNGSKLEGLLWGWRFEADAFDVLDEHDGRIKRIQLNDIKGGKFYSDRVRELSSSESLLERAVKEGWNK